MKMTRFIALLTVALMVGSTAADAACGPNSSPKEENDDQSDCCPEPKDQNLCPDACATACKCNLAYRRAYNGTCIPARDCPPIPCGKNEYFEPCPVCTESCSSANPEGRRCPKIGKIGITIICDPKCRCIENYWRNNEGECVPYNECPNIQCQC